MIRRLARRLLDHLRPPRIPSEPPTGRPRPTTAADLGRPAAPDPAPADEPEVEVEAATVKAWMEAGRPVRLVDIREPYEVAQGYATGALLLPMNSVPDQLARLSRDEVLIVYCAAGVRSFGVAHYLREQGYPEAWSLVGGLGAYLETGAPWERPGGPAAG